MNSTLTTFNAMTEVPLSKAPNPPIAPQALEQWLPTAPGVCSQCVCSLLTAVCVHLDGLNAEDQFNYQKIN